MHNSAREVNGNLNGVWFCHFSFSSLKAVDICRKSSGAFYFDGFFSVVCFSQRNLVLSHDDIESFRSVPRFTSMAPPTVD
jgi:hypothetical protein